MISRFVVNLSLCVLVLFAASAMAQTATPTAADKHEKPFEFDEFMLVLLVRPPNPPDFPKEQIETMQKEHIANIERLAAEGKMVKAGPVEDYSNRNVRGIFILKTNSQERAREWIKDDAFIKVGRLVPEFMKWYVAKGALK